MQRLAFTSIAIIAAAMVALGVRLSGAPDVGSTTVVDPSTTTTVHKRAESVRQRYFRDLDGLDARLATLDESSKGSADAALTAFRNARIAYKTVESLAEYYSPATAKAMNGAVLDRAEEEAPSIIIRPTGFQVIEASLFPATNANWRTVVREQVAIIRVNLKRVRLLAAETKPTDGHVFEAARLEMGRIVTLGLAGFDASLSGDATRESAAALRGVSVAILPYAATVPLHVKGAWDSAVTRLERAARYLDAHSEGQQLDPLRFIEGFANPAARALDSLRRALAIELPPGHPAWSRDVATLFDVGAFDASAFAPSYAPHSSRPLVDLGRDLFFDTQLSGNGTRACASCHQPSLAFTDGRQRRAALSGARDAGRNTPTVLNVGLEPSAFFDMRVAYLEDQITEVMGNAEEMNHAVAQATSRLRETGAYTSRFQTAFGVTGDSAVSAERLRMALAAYLRSLQTLNSRFDRATRGDSTVLTNSERRGFSLFMGKAKCGTCHFAPLFNGATPPTFVESEPEVIGTPAERRGTPDHSRIDADVGRFAIDRIELHRHAFKTPSLRNIALTAPYMHNGVFATLDQVLDFYNDGGGVGIGLTVPNQTLPADSLHLTRMEKQNIIAFLRTLTDTETDKVGTTRVGLPVRP